MCNVRRWTLAWVCLLLVSGGTTANAAFMLGIEFNVNGVLPSADPGLGFFNNTGTLESARYSVSGGLLQQRTFGVNGNASYIYPDVNETGGSFTPTEDFSMEARVRVLRISGEFGAYFQAFNGASTLSVGFRADGVVVQTAMGLATVPVDVFSFHTYRLESSANSGTVQLRIDGNLAFSGNLQPYTGLNGFDFGDGITGAGNGADADYDFIRVSSQAPSVAVVPEPASLFLLASGSAGLLWGRTWRSRRKESASA